jgi:hypothetical protein
MADSAVAITAGAGTNIDTRTEGTNSNHRQVVVIGDPATNAGVAPVDVTNGLAVDVKAAVITSGTITTVTTLTTITNDVSIDDGGNAITIDWAGTAPPIGAGTEATALRVTLATDSTGVITVDNAGTFVVQEDGAALTALQILDNIVYSEDVATPVTIIGAAILMERDDSLGTLTPVEGDWVGFRSNARGAVWCELDLTNDVTIADGGNSITVDWNGTTPPIGAGTEAAALRVTLATDSTGTLTVNTTGNSGLEVVQDTAADLNCTEASAATILTSVQIMDDWDATHDSAIGADGAVFMAEAIETDGTAPGTAVAEADATRLKSGRDGVLLTNPTHPFLFNTTDNQSIAQTNTALKAAPGAGLSLYITDIIISNGATAGNVKIVEDTSGIPVDIIEVMYFAINGGMSKKFRTPIRASANVDIGYTSVTSTTHSVTISGYTAP